MQGLVGWWILITLAWAWIDISRRIMKLQRSVDELAVRQTSLETPLLETRNGTGSRLPSTQSS
jgi:hypothetical protein